MSTDGLTPIADDSSRQPRRKIEISNMTGDRGTRQAFFTTNDVFDVEVKDLKATNHTDQWGGRMSDETGIQMSKDSVTITSRAVPDAGPEAREGGNKAATEGSEVMNRPGYRLGDAL